MTRPESGTSRRSSSHPVFEPSQVNRSLPSPARTPRPRQESFIAERCELPQLGRDIWSERRRGSSGRNLVRGGDARLVHSPPITPL